MINNNIPLVSIFCPAYNHESYIKQCLEGFILQKCNFSIEVYVQDDASSDKTAEIIKMYAEKYNYIIPRLHTENYYSNGKDINAYFFSQALGKYIAICEGDDYWTDPYKLQKQVDFLEANEDYCMCSHNINSLHNNILQDYYTSNGINPPSDTITLKDLALQNYLPTVSVIFKKNNQVLSDLNTFKNLTLVDYCLHLLNARYGKIKILKDNMAVYRIHNDSLWSSQGQFKCSLMLYTSLLSFLKSNFFLEVSEELKTQLAPIAWFLYNNEPSSELKLNYLKTISDYDLPNLQPKFEKKRIGFKNELKHFLKRYI